MRSNNTLNKGQMKKFILTILLSLIGTPLMAQWTPPMGVPAPPIGINTTATTPTTLGSTFTKVCDPALPCLVSGGTYGWTDITGSNLIIEKAHLYGMSISKGAKNIVIRDSEFIGDKTGGGITIGNGDAGAATNIVLLRNKFHDIGDVNASTDADVHCIGVGYESSYVWILDNDFYRCGGDGVQVNGGVGRGVKNLHHIYIGRNTATHNRQNGFWIKDSSDVIVSQNTVTNMKANSGGPGNCLGTQYGSLRIVFIGNRVSGCPYGIAIASDSGDSFGPGALIYNNVIFNTFHDLNNGPEDKTSGYSDNTAILLAGGTNRFLFNNTIVNVGGAIGIPPSGGFVAGANNLLTDITRSHITLEGSTQFNLQYTLFGETPILYQALTTFAVVGKPVFKDQTNGDYTVQNGPGFGNAFPIDINGVYKTVFGVDYLSVHGVNLPNPDTNIGAFGTPLLPHLVNEPGQGPVINPPPDTRPLCSTVNPAFPNRFFAIILSLCK